tara:strand:+ start:391 stop:660 length:270 start_codon:yes stop_codon:yes gene_type:complete
MCSNDVEIEYLQEKVNAMSSALMTTEYKKDTGGLDPSIPTDAERIFVESCDDLNFSECAYLEDKGSAQTDSENGERWVLCWARMPKTEV